MFPYLVCLLPALLVAIFVNDNDQLKYKIDNKLITYSEKSARPIFYLTHRYFWIFLIPLAFLIAFRGEAIGADSDSYNSMYLAMLNGSFNKIESYDRIEIGYRLFLMALTFLSNDPQTQYIVCAILFVIMLGIFVKRNAVSSARFVVLFMGMNLFTFYLSGVRQSLAMLICLFAYESIKKKEPIKFVIIVLIAMTFHKAALFFFFAYPMGCISATKKTRALYIAMFIFVVVCNGALFKFAGGFFDIQYGIEETDNGYVMVLLMSIITILSFALIKPLVERNPDNKYLINLNAIHMAMWLLRLFSRTAERPSMFYAFFTILLIEQMILLVKDYRVRFLINMLVVALFGAYFIYRIDGLGLVPFEFCW